MGVYPISMIRWMGQYIIYWLGWWPILPDGCGSVFNFRYFRWRVDIVGIQNNTPEKGDIGEVAILWGPILA